MVSDRLDRFAADVNLQRRGSRRPRAGAGRGADRLRANSRLTGSDRAAAHGAAGGGKSSDFARVFYTNAIQRTGKALGGLAGRAAEARIDRARRRRRGRGHAARHGRFAPRRAALFAACRCRRVRRSRRGRAAARRCSCGVARCKRPAAAEAASGPQSVIAISARRCSPCPTRKYFASGRKFRQAPDHSKKEL